MKRQWTTDELIDQWTLTPQDLEWVRSKTAGNRLGFALLLTYFHHEGHFPRSKGDVPGAVIAFIARQVGVSADTFLYYVWGGRTMEYHRAQIREHLTFHAATVQDTEDLYQFCLGSWRKPASSPDFMRLRSRSNHNYPGENGIT